VNVCGACGLDFGSVPAFDAHRVGKHAYLYSEQRPDGRRCLTEQEMYSSPKFAKNERGRWSLARSLEHGRAQRVQRGGGES
jgi:hypothetical protein